MPGKADIEPGEDRWTALRGVPAEAKGLDNPSPGDGAAYYDISMLKPPVWRPEVGAYFFLGGLSAGAFVLARLAERFGGPPFRPLTRTGTTIAALAVLPCAPLLIVDLGDPKRFHHMLRVWKPGSPMNLGSWTLSGYTVCALLAAGREWLRARRGDAPPLHPFARAMDSAAGVAVDAAGIPLALLLAGYTGVLLSTTAAPIWCKNPWLGMLFSASAIGSGASALRLALEVAGEASGPDEGETPSGRALQTVETAARLAEAVAHTGFLHVAGTLARPLHEGALTTQYWAGAIGAGLIVPEALERLPAPPRARRWLRILAGVAALVGGYALRASLVAAGRPSASDPEAARQVSRADKFPNLTP